MTGYLLDTNHAGAILRGDTLLRARLGSARDAEFNLCMPSIGELWFMVFKSLRQTENRERLEMLLDRFLIREYDAGAAMEFGRIRVELQSQGRPIPQIDVQIAAIARVHGLTLLTSDRHFDAVSNLRIEDWTG